MDRKKLEHQGLYFDSRAEIEFWDLWGCLYPNISLVNDFSDWEKDLHLSTGNKKRKRHVDFAHLESKTAIEYQGGIWSIEEKKRSGHVGGIGQLRDYVKSQDLASIGWLLIPVGTGQINRQTLAKIEKTIQLRMPIKWNN